MDLEQGDQSPVNIKLNFRNITFVGLANAEVYKVSGFNENPQGDKLDIRFKTPKITIAGPYKINGKVLILPIQGDGLCNLTLGNLGQLLSKTFLRQFISCVRKRRSDDALPHQEG